MQQILLSLGYSHLSEHAAILTHVNFATQLEAYGLWHWAIFVMLHLKDAGKRKTAVMNLLQRHIEIDDTADDSIEREKFLREELGIPSTWIDHAKAVKSYVAKRLVYHLRSVSIVYFSTRKRETKTCNRTTFTLDVRTI